MQHGLTHRWGFPSAGHKPLDGRGYVVDRPIKDDLVIHGSSRLSTYGTILTASHCGASRRGPGTRPRAVVCWRWPRSTMVAAGRMRRGSAASVCRSFATGCSDRTGWSMGSHRAHPRSSTPITAAHWRRLLRPARSRRSRRRALAAQGPGAGGSWRRSPSRCDDSGAS